MRKKNEKYDFFYQILHWKYDDIMRYDQRKSFWEKVFYFNHKKLVKLDDIDDCLCEKFVKFLIHPLK